MSNHPPFAGLSADRADVLERLIREYGIRSVIEIGSFVGDSAAWFSKRVTNVYCIDPMHVIQEGWKPEVLAAGWPLDYEDMFWENVQTNGIPEKVVLYKGTSEEIWSQVPIYVVDAVYVDGDHSYEGCLFDIQNYQHAARMLICGDDHHYDAEGKPYFPGVVQACRESFGADYHVEGITWWKAL